MQSNTDLEFSISNNLKGPVRQLDSKSEVAMSYISKAKQIEKIIMPQVKLTERRKQLHNDDYKDYLERQLQESEQTVSSRNIHLNLYQDRLKQMEEKYRKSIDEIQEIRLKYHSTVKQLTNVKKICDQLEHENAKLYDENKNFMKMSEANIASNSKFPERFSKVDKLEENSVMKKNIFQEFSLTFTVPKEISTNNKSIVAKVRDIECKTNATFTTEKGETILFDDWFTMKLESLLLQQNTGLLDSLVDKIVTRPLKVRGISCNVFEFGKRVLNSKKENQNTCLFDCQQATKNRGNQELVGQVKDLKQQVKYLQHENLHLKNILKERAKIPLSQQKDEFIKKFEKEKEDLKMLLKGYIKKLKGVFLLKYACIDVNSPLHSHQSSDEFKREYNLLTKLNRSESENKLHNSKQDLILNDDGIRHKKDKNYLNNEMSLKSLNFSKQDASSVDCEQKNNNLEKLLQQSNATSQKASLSKTDLIFDNIESEHTFETKEELVSDLIEQISFYLDNHISILESKLCISDKDLVVLMNDNETHKKEITNLNAKIVHLTEENNRNINKFEKELKQRSYFEEICLPELKQTETQLLILKDSLLKLQEERLNQTLGLRNLNKIINEIFGKFEHWSRHHDEIKVHNEFLTQENETLKNKFRILQKSQYIADNENRELKRCCLSYFGPHKYYKQLNIFAENHKLNFEDFNGKQLSNLHTEVNLFKIKCDFVDNNKKSNLSLTYDVKQVCDTKIPGLETSCHSTEIETTENHKGEILHNKPTDDPEFLNFQSNILNFTRTSMDNNDKITFEPQQEIDNNQNKLKLFNKTKKYAKENKVHVDEIKRHQTTVNLGRYIKKVENFEVNRNESKISETNFTIFQQEILYLFNKDCWKISEVINKIKDWEIMYKNLIEQNENKINFFEIENESLKKKLQQFLKQYEQHKAELEKTIENKINKIREMMLTLITLNESIKEFENKLNASQIENEILKQEVNLLRDQKNIYLAEMNERSENLKSLVQCYDQELVSHENQVYQLEQQIMFINENQDLTNLQNGFVNIIEKYKSALDDCELEIKNMQEAFQTIRKYTSALKIDKHKLQSQAIINNKCKQTEKNTQKVELEIISDNV